ncbi:Uncharacterized protein TCAP_02466 [Tolypocladium capitatum]|uniref:Srp40 C-terminal domain-containing protein n=1 Tax=Tolypocladium capitatum TaxID=45235 RepID=A0A2K3QJC6_9HYPO|nr:Uncharacterized protein TCAP_02466 [Tolypocladium capitatum]
MSSRGPPSWLFSNNTDNKKTAGNAIAGGSTKKSKQATDKMANKSRKAAPPAKKEAPASQPPSRLMDMVEKFLEDHSFSRAHNAFKKQREQSGSGDSESYSGNQSLVDVYQSWEASQGPAISSRAKAAESDSSSDESSSDESSSSSESESEGEDDKPKKAVATLKRKAPASSDPSDSSSDSSSSDSDSSSDSSSDSASKPQPKKQKIVAAAADADSNSDSDSSADSKMDTDKEASSDSDSDSDDSESSSSNSDSDSEVAKVEVAAKVPLPESDSSSDSSSDDSDSDSEDNKATAKKPNEAKAAVIRDVSDSSVTLDAKSPEPKVSTANPPLPPDPVTTGRDGKKKQNERFSRIPKSITVDEKFASNGYIPMAYSQRAFDDLVVTKGKGFTKEKNKKKRGSFRGGMIDIHQKKGVYFDD